MIRVHPFIMSTEVKEYSSLAANGTSSSVFIADATADRSSRMNSEVCRAMFSVYTQPNASKLIGEHFSADG